MTPRELPPLADLKADLAALKADLEKMVTLRWELARLELREAVGPGKRLAITLLAAAVMGLCALPILAVAAAVWFDGRLEISSAGWLSIFGFGLLLGGAAAGYLGWRRFRRRFVIMQQTLEELREDLVWLKEMMNDE